MLALATTSHHGNLLLAVLALLVAPFDINCPEMVYKQYLRQKAAQLKQHPEIDLNINPDGYKKAQGQKICSYKVLQDQVFLMLLLTVYNQSCRGIIQTDKEVYTFINHC